MKQQTGFPVRFRSPLNQETAQAAVTASRLFASLTDSQTADLARELEFVSFQLGDPVYQYANPDQSQNSAYGEPNTRDVYLILQGRLRFLGWNVQQHAETSVLVLEEGAIFGADHLYCDAALSYTAIAASAGQVAKLSHQTLERFPHLQEALQQQTLQRQRLIFFKTQTEISKQPTAQIQGLVGFVEDIHLPQGTRLAQLEACQDGLFWLRRGEIQSRELQSQERQREEGQPSEPPLEIGSQWQDPTPDWVAQTDVWLYKISTLNWQRATSSEHPATAPATHSVPLAAHLPSQKTLSKADLFTQDSDLDSHPSTHTGQAKRHKRNSKQQKPETTILQFPKPTKSRYKRRFWQRHPFIQQQSETDCSVTCLAMIGQYWGTRLSLNALREQARVSRSGASLKNLAIAAEQVGFQAKPIRASLDRLAEQTNPWIAHWQGDHYVVVYRIKGNQVLVADPARGSRSLPRQAFLTHWTGYGLLLDPTDDLYVVEHEAPSLQRFSGLLWSYRSVLAQVILISLLIQLFGLVTPLFTQVILDRVVTQKSLMALNVFAVGLLMFSIWRVGMTGIRQYLLDYFSNRIDLSLISGFIGHALRLPLKFFESRHVGDILTRVQENQKIQLFLVRQAVSTWLDGSMAIVYLGLMFYYNWRLALLVVALIPPIVILALIATPWLRKVSRDVFNETADQNSLLVEMMTGISTVKTAAAEREVRWRWEDRLTRMLNARFRGQKLANGLQISSGLINAIGSTALLWYGASLVIAGQLTIGQFVAFNLMIGSVLTPVLAIVGFWDELQEVVISVERLNDVLLAQPEELTSRPMLILPPIQGDVRFEQVNFRYEDTNEGYILQNLSFHVEVGQTIAIVGRSGSGKSTLIKLLQAFYTPSNGRVCIDGHDVQHVSPSSLRSQLGVVPQECFLFSGTVLENIQLYRSEHSLEAAIEVAKLAEAHAFIQELPLGYNTKVGERGTNLSGGQRQRIAIARALLGNPAILILDEATSSLDTESERRFQQNLARISQGRTTFIIAHRLSTVRHADRVLVLDQGILIEQGTHQDLLDKQGLYYHLAQQQLDV
ncbi:peptidase domain-containing ABC transporter [Myxacorys almedinensis]|uniref:ATP-binding cassette domain-containing protein n=1 Tax=Myxacorys almedinensis A TaxID=2690445 RepID=A0A8J7ZAC7_9CYAN|nr:peptidase domain-containing ABC transporter [Myxacorys almedinensis]NDJ19288.1 ATP-binding cassette domain-containing protein [Myxacorys almedinensis A]